VKPRAEKHGPKNIERYPALGVAGRRRQDVFGDPRDEGADESERFLAAELAGDFTVINDDLAEALLSVACRGKETEDLRTRAAISLGPALEQAYMEEFEDPKKCPLANECSDDPADASQALHGCRRSKKFGGGSSRPRCALRRTGPGRDP